MHLIFCLSHILTEFRPLFKRQNFALFCTLIVGLITHRYCATLTGIYQTVRPKSGYGSLVKFLSRGKWDADAVAKRLIQLLQNRFGNWVYVYDETHAIKTGTKQFGLHFFRNHRYQKRNTNQSKFHSGHQFGALGLLCSTVTETILFPVWVKLICPTKVSTIFRCKKAEKRLSFQKSITILKGELNAPHFLPQSYFNRVSSVIQASKLRPVLHIDCGSDNPPLLCHAHRYLSNSSTQEQVRFIGEIPLPWEMGRRCSS